MPKVGGKHFAYSEKGKKAAKAYAKETGQSVGKYEGGGNVDPFSTRNPEGVPAEQLAEIMENQNMANQGLPTSNAQERSQVSPDVEQYKDGGKVDVTDVVKKAGEWEGFYYPKREEFEDPSKVKPVDIIVHAERDKRRAVKKLAKKALHAKSKKKGKKK